MPKELSEKDKKKEIEKVLKYIDLVKIIRNSPDKVEQDIAFGEIVTMMEPKLKQFMYNFTIPGFDRNDIYQESLLALKFKAIKDYDSSRSEIKDISPFDKFAMICIRRHLSTKLKASYQHKNKVLNSSMSLNQDRNSDSDNDLFLSDILVEPNAEESIMQSMNFKEYQEILFKKLFAKLSVFEKKVFILYSQKLSYHEMSEKLFENISKEGKMNILMKHADEKVKYISKSRAKKHQERKTYFKEELENGTHMEKLCKEYLKDYDQEQKKVVIIKKVVKSIDNALSRIKAKAKETFEKHG